MVTDASANEVVKYLSFTTRPLAANFNAAAIEVPSDMSSAIFLLISSSYDISSVQGGAAIVSP